MKKLPLLFALLISALTAFTQSDYSFEVDHAGDISLGIALGGGGIVGVPLRYNFGPTSAIELGAFYRPVLYVDEFENLITSGSVMFVFGPQLSLGRTFKEHKRKMNSNGLFLKGGHSFGLYSESLAALGWVLEGFREETPNRSFIFELGAGLSFRHWVDDPFLPLPDGVANTTFLIYWKVHWNWYLGK